MDVIRRTALALLLGLWAASAQTTAAQTPASGSLPAHYSSTAAEIDGATDFRPGAPWVPLLAVDWEANEAHTEVWLRPDWSHRGLHLSLRLPNAREEVRSDAGRAPAAPFQVVVEIVGGAGAYTVRCIPLLEPVSRMTTRLHAYLFNHRLGANARPGESGHVLCHETSLLGILADSMETRWSAAREGGLEFEALIPWQTLRLPVPAPGMELPFSVRVSQPSKADVRWAGGALQLIRGGDSASATAGSQPLLPTPYVRQPATLVAAYPLSTGAASAGGLSFALMDAAGSERARSDGAPAGDAAFGRLPTEGLPDGAYTLRVLRGERVVARRPVRLIGQKVDAEIEEVRVDLIARLGRLDRRSLSETLRGHVARAERMLELARLSPHPDSAEVALSTGILADATAVIDALEAGRRPGIDQEGFGHPAGFAMDGPRGPVTFVPSSDPGARLTIHGDRAMDWALTRRLYGTFSEPVVYDRPIYSWLWAQQLRNPSFEFGHPTAEQTAEAFIGSDELEPDAARAALGGRWLPRPAAGVEEVAAPWIAVGRGTARYALECDAYNDRQCQRVIAAADAREVGVAQVLELPAWRTTGYRLSGFMRSDGSVGEARVVLYHEGRAIDSVTAGGIDTAWSEFAGELRAPALDGPRNTFLLAAVFDGPGSLDLDLVTLYPDDAVDGFDPQALTQLRELNTGWVRWPGGNYASDYHWTDGVGPRDLRPSTPNPSWPGLNPNFVGTDEFLQLGERLGFDVMITVNAGSGTAEEAARWVEYVNGDTSTVLGRLRARNGHPEPYDVRYWNIGNELWGHWQVGYTNPEEYARRYAAFAQAMREVDPSIHVIANAHGGHSESPPDPWNRPLLEHYGEELETLDIHTYVSVPNDAGHSPAEQAFLLSAIPLSYEQWLAEFRQDLVRRGLEDVRVIVGEYNASTRSGDPAMDDVADLLVYGAYLHAYMRQGEYVTGANATEYSAFNPRALPFDRMHPRYDLFRIYASHAGTVPVEATLETPVRQQPNQVGRDVLPIFNLPVVDAVALRDTAGGSLGISLINRNMEEAVPVEVRVEGYQPGSDARWFLFQGDGDGVREQTLDAGATMSLTLPPHSVSLLKLYPADVAPAPSGSPSDTGSGADWSSG